MFNARTLRLTVQQFAPGVALAIAVAVAAVSLEAVFAALAPRFTGVQHRVPALVLALLIGMMLHARADRTVTRAGLAWCVRVLLRVSIALLGLRIALSDIADLGLWTAVLVVGGMVAALASAMLTARLLGLSDGYGALSGAAVSVCGASATLATSTVVPAYPGKDRDVAFTVISANAVSTMVMLAYPALCLALGLTSLQTGVMLGGTIHDMAQVVGGAYAVSEEVGALAVIVKLFRIFLLLPVVLAVGWWFLRRGEAAGRASVPVPVFALVFLALCILNSVGPSVPGLSAILGPVKIIGGYVSSFGLLVAIAALGLGTSLSALLTIGWRHIAVFLTSTLVIAVVVLGALVVH